MSHHSSEDDGRMKAMRAAMEKLFGEFPDGKLNAEDAGALAMVVEVESGKVKLMFPKPIAWIGFTPDGAIELAELLVKHARKCGSKKPLQLHIG